MEENAEPSFRVSVSLSRFFEDERALCYLWVESGRRVRWLQRRLRRLFALPRRVALLSRGHLLPPDEPLALLRPDDPVEVIPLSAECDWSFKNLSSKTIRFFEAEKDNCKDFQHSNSKSSINPIEVKVGTLNNEINTSMDTIDVNESETHVKKAVNSEKDKEYSDTERHEKNQLEQIKKQALALLENYEETKLTIVNSADPAGVRDQSQRPRARRRVRRRRPRNDLGTASISDYTLNVSSLQSEVNEASVSSPALELECNVSRCLPSTSSAPMSNGERLEPFPSSNYIEFGVAGAAVLRNNEAAPRAPRLVHPLVGDA